METFEATRYIVSVNVRPAKDSTRTRYESLAEAMSATAECVTPGAHVAVRRVTGSSRWPKYTIVFGKVNS